MFGYVLLAIAAFMFVFVSEAAFIVFGGILIALAFLAIAKYFKKKVPGSRNLLLVVTIISLIVLIFGASWFASAKIASEMQFFVDQFPKALDQVMDSARKNFWFDKLKQEAQEVDWMKNFVAPKVIPKTAKFATILVNGVTAFFIALVLGVYFAADSKRYRSLIRLLVPRNQGERYLNLTESLAGNLQRWLLGKLLSMTAVAVLTYIGLLALQVKAPFPLAFLAGFLSFIPNVGPIMSALPAVIIAFSQGWKMSLYVALLYILVQSLEGTLITPLIQKRGVKLLPGGLIAFQFFMAVLYGFGGLFMATPLLVALMTVVDEFWVKSPSR